MSTGMKVTFGTITQAQSDVSMTIGNMNGQLSDLRSYLAPMVSAWEGGASADYQELQKRWDKSADELNRILDQIRNLLGQSHDAYDATERSNAGTWLG